MKFSEGMGFEPMGAKSSAELAIRFFRPLRHPSTIKEQKVYQHSIVLIHKGILIFIRKIIAILNFMSIFKISNPLHLRVGEEDLRESSFLKQFLFIQKELS